MATFTSVPTLDLALADGDAAAKTRFLADLRHGLVVVGFFYLKNTGIDPGVQARFMKQTRAICDLPLEKKLKMDMINSKHFLGYCRMGYERTAMVADNREFFDFLTPLPAPGPDEPVYMNVNGPNLWPDENDVPGFRVALTDYQEAINRLGKRMITFVAEALDLPPDTFHRFFNEGVPRNKTVLAKYSQLDQPQQGIGAHKDGSFLTYLLQVTAHRGLEVQNKAGQWISVPPVPGTLVINVGRSLESITSGVCTATTHRVLLGPEYSVDEHGNSLGSRYSVPVFQTLKLTLTSEEMRSVRMPDHIAALVKDETVKSDAETFMKKYHLESPGKAIFTARITSQPDVGLRWYPAEAEEILRNQESELQRQLAQKEGN